MQRRGRWPLARGPGKAPWWEPSRLTAEASERPGRAELLGQARRMGRGAIAATAAFAFDSPGRRFRIESAGSDRAQRQRVRPAAQAPAFSHGWGGSSERACLAGDCKAVRFSFWAWRVDRRGVDTVRMDRFSPVGWHQRRHLGLGG